MNNISLQTTIPTELDQKRLDAALAQLFGDFSRSQLKAWILAEQVTVNGDVISAPRHKMSEGDRITLNAELEDQGEWQAQDIPLEIIHEDDDVIIINKPAGLVVHPGAGIKDGTLVNALLHHYPELRQLPRAGLIHRIDKDTTGLLVVARSQVAHTKLNRMLQKRHIDRHYKALVIGELIAGGSIDEPIGRDPHHRTKMAVHPNGRDAVTHYRVAEKFPFHTLLDVKLESGRTHQIRVHMTHIHHPLVGDATYNKRLISEKGMSDELRTALREFRRQALHAYQLGFKHPVTGKDMQWTAALPEDFEALVAVLKNDLRDSNA